MSWDGLITAAGLPVATLLRGSALLQPSVNRICLSRNEPLERAEPLPKPPLKGSPVLMEELLHYQLLCQSEESASSEDGASCRPLL